MSLAIRNFIYSVICFFIAIFLWLIFPIAVLIGLGLGIILILLMGTVLILAVKKERKNTITKWRP